MQIYVFDRSLNFTGAIDNYSSLRWRRRFNQFSEFELHCPLNADNLSLLIRGSIICKSDYTQEAGFIEYRELQQNEQGEEFLVIKGKFLKSYLSRRIIWLQELLNCTHEVAMRTLVKDQCITPTLTDRIIPNLQLGTLKSYAGNINYQVTYNNLFDELINLTNLSNLGFRILLDTVNKKLNFDVYQGLDRTAGQAINPTCIFSADFDNILSQNYIDSSNNLKNVALVAGVGVGSARKLVAVGSSAGLDRFEMFVDANNLSNINSVDSSVIADDVYLPMLTAKGTADLALTSDIKTFDSKVNTNSNLVYKTDYDLGDKVTCLNKKWGLTMDTVIVEIEEIYEAQGTKINVVFGNNIPTLADKIKITSNQNSNGTTSSDAGVDSKAQVFRAYMSTDFAKAAGSWEWIPFNLLKFNTLQGTFDAANRKFTPSKAGYYQVGLNGYTPTGGTGRYALSVYKNGAAESINGGNYDTVDNPLAPTNTILYLNGTTDYISIGMFSAIAVTLQGGTNQYGMYWHMNYLGA